MSRPPLEVADLIRTAGSAFLERNRKWLGWQQRKALLALASYRRSALQTATDSSLERIRFPRPKTGSPGMIHEEKVSWKKRVIGELRSLSVTVLYIWVLLTVFNFYREIILANYHINYSAKFGFAFINAVILAKFMWLGEILHAEKKPARKTLLYATLWNSALFTVILMFCHLVEETLVKVWHGQSFTASVSETVADPRDIFASMLLVFVVLIPFESRLYCAISLLFV
jgi:hypothetical protein